jgi:hypothetical protein
MSSEIVKNLIDEFMKYSKDAFLALQKGERKKLMPLDLKLRDLYCQLRDCGDEGVRALEELTRHEDMGVQLKAASKLAWINLPLTLEVMEDLRRGAALYPVGTYERRVAHTADAVCPILRNRGPLGPDPYIKWQAAKEASGAATKPAKQSKGVKRTSEGTKELSSPDTEPVSTPSMVSTKRRASTQGKGETDKPVSEAETPPPRKNSLRLLEDMYQPRDIDSDEVLRHLTKTGVGRRPKRK